VTIESGRSAFGDAPVVPPRKSPVLIDGREFSLCGDFGPMVEAEAYYGFNLADVVLAWGQDHESILNGAKKLLPCALRPFHPEVSYSDSQSMLERSLATDDPSILKALWNMWPPRTKETADANDHLRCDLDSLAAANELFEGKPNLLLICVEGYGFHLGDVWRVWPCALRHYRPDLSLEESGKLLTLEGVRLVIGLLGIVNETASQAARDRFAERVMKVSSQEQKQDFLFRVMAKRLAHGAAQA